jgi:anti-anti-sigma regulatory factor
MPEREHGAGMNNIELQITDEVCRLSLTGKLDVFEGPSLLRAAREAIDANRPLVIQIEGLHRLDISIFQILLALQQDAYRQNQPLQMIGAGCAVQRISHLLGGDRYLFHHSP